MSAIMTVHFATRSSDEPDRLRSSPILVIAEAVSPAIPAFALSTPSWPATNSRLPTRTTDENGPLRLFGTTNSGRTDAFPAVPGCADAPEGAIVGLADEQATHAATIASA